MEETGSRVEEIRQKWEEISRKEGEEKNPKIPTSRTMKTEEQPKQMWSTENS